MIFGDNRLPTISDKNTDELEDSVPYAFGPVDESVLPNYTGKHFSILVWLVLFTILNFSAALFHLSFEGFWFWGMIATGVLSLVISFFLTPMPLKDDSPNPLLDDFKEFEKMPLPKKRFSALISVLIVLGIWTAGLLSFVFYLKITIFR